MGARKAAAVSAVGSAGIMPVIVAGVAVAGIVGIGGYFAINGLKNAVQEGYEGIKDVAGNLIDTTLSAGTGIWSGLKGDDPRTRFTNEDEKDLARETIDAFDWSGFRIAQAFQLTQPVPKALPRPVLPPDEYIDLLIPLDIAASNSYSFGGSIRDFSIADMLPGAGIIESGIDTIFEAGGDAFHTAKEWFN